MTLKNTVYTSLGIRRILNLVIFKNTRHLKNRRIQTWGCEVQEPSHLKTPRQDYVQYDISKPTDTPYRRQLANRSINFDIGHHSHYPSQFSNDFQKQKDQKSSPLLRRTSHIIITLFNHSLAYCFQYEFYWYDFDYHFAYCY